MLGYKAVGVLVARVRVKIRVSVKMRVVRVRVNVKVRVVEALRVNTHPSWSLNL